MIDLAALVQRAGDALEAAATFPDFPKRERERESQTIEAKDFSRISRISRNFSNNTGETIDTNVDPGRRDASGPRAREATSEERETRETREKPYRARGFPFPFLDEETGKTGNPTPVGAPGGASFDSDDWRAAFDERAGFLEFDAGLSRHEAERLALQEITTQYGTEPARQPQ